MRHLKQILSQGSSVIKWWRVLEYPRLARSLLKRVILLIQGRFSKEYCIAVHLFLRDVYRLGRRSGWLFCSLYLKQCSVCLKAAYGGEFNPSVKLAVPVSLTGSGFPRIIPSFHRHRMMKRDVEADKLVKFWLSMFTFSGIIEKAKRMTKDTFRSITSPVEDIDSVKSWVGSLKSHLPTLIDRYLPDVASIPLVQGMRWLPSGKTLPSYRTLKFMYSKGGLFSEKEKYLKKLSPLMVQSFELSSFRHLVEFTHARGEQWSQGALFAPYTRYALDPCNKIFSGLALDFFESRIGPHLPKWHPALGPPMTGCLGQKVEGGGKRRIFAMGNWVNQRLLSPVNDWLSSVLKTIRMDGAFNQTKPLDYLKGKMDCHSLDLTSATDRWPLLVMFEVMCYLFDRSFASSTVNSLLATNIFLVPFLKRKKKEGYLECVSDPKKWISFVAGQPLGYRSSWTLFSLTNHMVVWWSAEQVYPGLKFQDYAILGDDIVIADGRVASKYREALSKLGVGISESKSLISATGALEFAKRFRVRGASVDLSPISVKSTLGAHIPVNRMALNHLYPMKFSTFRRLGGRGFKVLRQTPCFLLKKQKILGQEEMEYLLWLRRFGHPLHLYLGAGIPLTSEEFWYIYRYSVTSQKPKDITPFDSQSLPNPEDQQVFLEYTQIRATVDAFYNLSFSDWLKHYRYAECLDVSGLKLKDSTRYFSVLDEIWRLPAPLDWMLNNGSVSLTSLTLFLKLRRKLKYQDREHTIYLPPGRMEVWIAMLDGPIVVWDCDFLARLCIPYPDGTYRRSIESGFPVLYGHPTKKGSISSNISLLWDSD